MKALSHANNQSSLATPSLLFLVLLIFCGKGETIYSTNLY